MTHTQELAKCSRDLRQYVLSLSDRIMQIEAERDEARDAALRWYDVTNAIGGHRSCNCIACTELIRYVEMELKDPL